MDQLTITKSLILSLHTQQQHAIFSIEYSLWQNESPSHLPLVIPQASHSKSWQIQMTMEQLLQIFACFIWRFIRVTKWLNMTGTPCYATASSATFDDGDFHYCKFHLNWNVICYHISACMHAEVYSGWIETSERFD